MSILNDLKLSDTAPAAIMQPKHRLRSKLLHFLMEQRAVAQADIEKRPYVATRMTSRLDENGRRVRVETPKHVRRAWFNNSGPNGTFVTFFQLRYGNRPLAIAKGKASIEVGDLEQLPAVIEKIIEAVHAGELDEVLTAAAAERKANFNSRAKGKA
jgi:hypothetical protein